MGQDDFRRFSEHIVKKRSFSQSTLRDLSAKVCTNPQFFFTEEQSNSEIPALGVNEIFFVKYGLDVLGQWSGKFYV